MSFSCDCQKVVVFFSLNIVIARTRWCFEELNRDSTEKCSTVRLHCEQCLHQWQKRELHRCRCAILLLHPYFFHLNSFCMLFATKDAASYCVSHLHCEIAYSKFYPSKPAEALREAFLNTDEKFIEKSKKQVSASYNYFAIYLYCAGTLFMSSLVSFVLFRNQYLERQLYVFYTAQPNGNQLLDGLAIQKLYWCHRIVYSKLYNRINQTQR